jgi:hypothetical protein
VVELEGLAKGLHAGARGRWLIPPAYAFREA